MSKNTVDRESPQACEAFVIGVVPDPITRLSCLRILRAGIVAAHSRSAAAWSVTLSGDFLRLNIGSTEAYTLWAGVIRVLVLVGDSATVPSALTPSTLKPSPYSSAPLHTQLLRVAPLQVVAMESWVCECFANFALKASVTKDGRPRGTSYSASHSPGVISYLSTTLNEAVPTPNFDTRG